MSEDAFRFHIVQAKMSRFGQNNQMYYRIPFSESLVIVMNEYDKVQKQG